LWCCQEAEQHNFTADDLQVALSHCGDRSPVLWLEENWRNMIDTVVTLATNYGHERRENNVGTISTQEARDALRMHAGNVWAAVTECVDQRQKKVPIHPTQFRLTFITSGRAKSIPEKVLTFQPVPM